jgi:hypothetical protein
LLGVVASGDVRVFGGNDGIMAGRKVAEREVTIT